MTKLTERREKNRYYWFCKTDAPKNKKGDNDMKRLTVLIMTLILCLLAFPLVYACPAPVLHAPISNQIPADDAEIVIDVPRYMMARNMEACGQKKIRI